MWALYIDLLQTEFPERSSSDLALLVLPFKLQIFVDLLFADLSIIWGFYPQHFLNRKRERKNDETYVRKRFRHNSLHEMLVIPVLEQPLFPTNVLPSHAMHGKKVDVEA